MKLLLSIVIAASFLSCVSLEQEGRVVKVIDGDTFDILDGNLRTRIRLFGIDSPERGQPFNRKAKEFTETLVADKVLRVVIRNKDRYGRSVAEAYLPNGTHVNAEIVKAGYAWLFSQYSNDPAIALLEVQARAAKRGLWEDEKAIPPWEYRRK